jgi:hypothetical protein
MDRARLSRDRFRHEASLRCGPSHFTLGLWTLPSCYALAVRESACSSLDLAAFALRWFLRWRPFSQPQPLPGLP